MMAKQGEAPRFVATCARHLEPVLAEELAELGVQPEIGSQAVMFAGTLEDAYRVCLWSRIANRVLLPLREIYVPTTQSLWVGVCKIRWREIFAPEATFAVHFVGTSDCIRNSHFGALKVKDAICDTFRKFGGERPNVDVKNPDLRIHVHLRKRKASIAIDLSGPLHQRGWNRDGGPAPLRETLAAAVLRWSEWTPDKPLVDPMCGSGTLLMEASAIAHNHAPGLDRPCWGFEGWSQHDPVLWAKLVGEAHAQRRGPGRIYGADIDPSQVIRARTNLRRAGLDAGVEIVEADMADAHPPEGAVGCVVSNPPYGERLDPDVNATWKQLGDVLRHRFLGWDVTLLGMKSTRVALRLRPAKRYPVRNGALACEVMRVPISTEPVRQR